MLGLPCGVPTWTLGRRCVWAPPIQLALAGLSGYDSGSIGGHSIDSALGRDADSPSRLRTRTGLGGLSGARFLAFTSAAKLACLKFPLGGDVPWCTSRLVSGHPQFPSCGRRQLLLGLGLGLGLRGGPRPRPLSQTSIIVTQGTETLHLHHSTTVTASSAALKSLTTNRRPQYGGGRRNIVLPAISIRDNSPLSYALRESPSRQVAWLIQTYLQQPTPVRLDRRPYPTSARRLRNRPTSCRAARAMEAMRMAAGSTFCGGRPRP